jgi:hypothetical protein
VKQLVHRKNETRWFAGYINNGSGYTDDRTAQLLSVVVEMARAGYGEFRPGRTYRDLAAQWHAIVLQNKITSPDFRAPCTGSECPAPTQTIRAANASILDFNQQVFSSECNPEVTPCSWDTSHYNTWALAWLYAYDAGIPVPLTHLQRTANLFTKVLWDGSVAFPRFRNRVDGRNSVFRKIRQPWQNGSIHDGFVYYGRLDSVALAAAEATMECIITNCGSPSVVYYGGESGRFNLAAGVMLSRLRYELGR